MQMRNWYSLKRLIDLHPLALFRLVPKLKLKLMFRPKSKRLCKPDLRQLSRQKLPLRRLPLLELNKNLRLRVQTQT